MKIESEWKWMKVNEGELKWMEVGRLQEQRLTPGSEVLRGFDICTIDWQTKRPTNRGTGMTSYTHLNIKSN